MAFAGVLDFPASTGGQLRLALYLAPARKGGREVPVLLHNLSRSGMLVESSHAMNLGDQIEIAFSEMESTSGEITWVGTRLFGCQFSSAVDVNILERTVSLNLGEERLENSLSHPLDTFGAKLQRLRMAKGLLQAEIAKMLGVSTVSVSHWESDRSQPRQHRMAELAKILGVSSQQLATNAVALPESLPEALASSKMQVAVVLGVNPANIRINVDL